MIPTVEQVRCKFDELSEGSSTREAVSYWAEKLIADDVNDEILSDQELRAWDAIVFLSGVDSRDEGEYIHTIEQVLDYRP